MIKPVSYTHLVLDLVILPFGCRQLGDGLHQFLFVFNLQPGGLPQYLIEEALVNIHADAGGALPGQDLLHRRIGDILRLTEPLGTAGSVPDMGDAPGCLGDAVEEAPAQPVVCGQ